jgi:hypothetical protein
MNNAKPEPGIMNLITTITDREFVITPRRSASDWLPLALFVVAFIACSTVFVFFALIGFPLSIADGEWGGTLICVLFALVSGWLIAKVSGAVLMLAPRSIRYSRATGTFTTTFFGIPFRVPRSSVRAVGPRLLKTQAGMNSVSAVWLFLVIETRSGATREFFLHTLPPPQREHRALIRKLFSDFAAFCDLPVRHLEVKK